MGRSLLIAVTGVCVCLAFAGCDRDTPPTEFSFEIMGTVASGKIHHDGDGSPVRMVEAVFDSINFQLSSWRDDSEVGRLNAAPAGTAVALSKWLNDCLIVSEALHKTSGGAFDPTAEPLMRLWGFYRRQGHLPSLAELDSVRTLMGGYTHDPDSRTLTKQRANVRFDLGGVAKGYAVDLAIADLSNAGIRSAMIDLGGNLFCLGAPPERDMWRVGVRDPLDKSLIFATMALTNQAVATSGAYERFVIIDGKRYGHIMNPATGRPAEGLLSVTVITSSATLADGLTTTLYVLGPDKAVDLLRTHYPNVDAILVLPGEGDEKARVLATPGLEGNLEIQENYTSRYLLSFLKF
jgi:FAD:protein FMN transferase